MRSRVVAIHQPNFLPWLGFFDKLSRADVFVLLDDVQFAKKGGTWTNRVQILVSGEPAWITVPVDRSYHGTRTIQEMHIDGSGAWRRRIIETIRQNYSRAAHFSQVQPVVEEILALETRSLCEFNIAGIRLLLDLMGLPSEHMVRSSTLGVSGRASELLAAITAAVGGETYLCGGGAAEYQEDEVFEDAGIRVLYQDFKDPRYPQRGTSGFVTGLSVVDALMNCGSAGTRDILLRDARML